jgi:histidinol-phosphatase (PHP family)
MEDHEQYFGAKSEREAYTAYFEMALATVESGLFDSFAHFDLCKRYGVLYNGKFKPERYRAEIEQVLKAVIEQDMVIEINTSGLRQAPGESYPAYETLKMYAELGGRAVTIGSDSHTTEQLGYGLRECLALLQEVGITEIARFEGRHRV